MVITSKATLGENFGETGWSAYGLFRTHRYHLELNCVACKATFKQRSFFGSPPPPPPFFSPPLSLSLPSFFFSFSFLFFFLFFFFSVLLYVHRNHHADKGRRTAFINQTTFERRETNPKKTRTRITLPG